jgi:ATP-dependent Clp protease ATP-binding subunit ClpC
LLKQLRNKFPPEFLNRLDDVIYFNKLTTDNLKEVIKIEIEKLNTRINNIGYNFEYDNSVVDFILEKIKDETEFGARPIMRAIQDTVEDKITDALLKNDYENGYVFKISCCPNLSEIVVA